MRQFIIILQVVLGILLAFIIFVGLVAQGSGHNIPVKTNVEFIVMSIILTLLLVLSSFIKAKLK